MTFRTQDKEYKDRPDVEWGSNSASILLTLKLNPDFSAEFSVPKSDLMTVHVRPPAVAALPGFDNSYLLPTVVITDSSSSFVRDK